jgi:hypothetical protein
MNLDRARLRKEHRAKLAKARRTSKRATSITEEHVCRNYRLLLPDGLSQQNYKWLWALHAAWVVGCIVAFDLISCPNYRSLQFHSDRISESHFIS